MKLAREYLIAFFFPFVAKRYISEFNKLMMQLTRGGTTDPTAIYIIHTERLGEIVTSIFETDYCR
jgi:hypothetical protein